MLSSLDESVRFYCRQGVADSTQRTYKAGIKRFHAFCEQHQVFNPLPVTELLLCQFSAFLANQGLSPQTVKVYLAAIRNLQLSLGLPDPRDTSALPRLRLLLAGVRRVRARTPARPLRVRLPISITILTAIKHLWERSAITHDTLMLWAAATMCFFGFFRSGEITTPSLTAFDPTVHLSWGDVAVDDPIRPKSIRIHLKRSKCDQFGAGVDIHLGRTTSPLCPVTAVLAYMASRQDTPGPFFRDERGRPLTKATFVQKVRHALSQLGLPAEQFAGHSFRIGAATAAAQAGLEDSVIQALGRWSSAAFLLYIRTPREHLTQFTARLASQPQASP